MRSAAVQKHGSTLLQKFRAPESGQKILVAVSGGVDSMVLLYLLKKLSATHRWKLTVAHFNHQLRGKASDADEAFVRKTAAAMKLPFVAGRADVKKFAKEAKLSIEMAARKLRHEFFVRMARLRKINTVALAHHADDQVELFFLRLLRGSGGGGLAGMKRRSPSPADGRISLVRPLLDFSKGELEQFAGDNKIRFREDVTNFSTNFLRNRIRHELLPLLRDKYQPALNKAILRLMEIAGAEADFVRDSAQHWLSRNELPQFQRNFEKLPLAIQRQALKGQLNGLGIAADFDLIESLRTSAGKQVAVVANVTVSRDKEGRVNVNEQLPTTFDENQMTVKLSKSGWAVFDGAKFKWQFAPQAKGKFVPPAPKPGTEFFDAGKMEKEIILRHWHVGDRFQPIGMKSSVKLQDLFINNKISRAQRHRLIVAVSGGEIFWVEGQRMSENFKLTPEAKRQLIWQWRR